MSVSGGYMGLKASLSVAFDKFKESSEDTAELTKNKVVFSSGGADMPAPIGLNLLPIDEAFSNSFFRVLSQQFQCENLAQRKKNVKQLLSNYPNLKGARSPNGKIESLKEIDRVTKKDKDHYIKGATLRGFRICLV